MDRLTKFLCLFAIFLATSTALKLELFDSTGFRGPYLVHSNEEACTNLTTSNFLQEGRSLKTDKCIMIFKAVNCTSHSFRVDPGVYEDLGQVRHEGVNFNNPQSYRMCTSGEGGTVVNIDISGNARTLDDSLPAFNGVLMKYRDICSCINLPTKNPYIGTVNRINNFGNCVKIYNSVNCTGDSVTLLGGVSPQSLNLTTVGSFIIPSSSIGLCEDRPTCFQLKSEIFKFVISADPDKVANTSSSSEIVLKPNTIIRNNGSSTLIQNYEAKTTLKENVEVTRVTQFSSINSYSILKTVKFEGTLEFPILNMKVSNNLVRAYSRVNSSEPWDFGGKFVSEEIREIGVQQQIGITNCSVYEVEASVTLVKNYPVEYTAFIYVRGSTKDRQLTAAEVKERLSEGLEYVEDFDEFTVIATGNGEILVDFSLEAVVNGKGSDILA